MPFNSVFETKKGVERFKLSLKKNNALSLNSENKPLLPENCKENSSLSENNKENRPQKRPFQSTYLNTLNASKRLKTLEPSQIYPKDSNQELIVLEEPLKFRSAMLNGHHQVDNQYGANSTTVKKTPIATLSNLGNTCFLNSVLYTLRYAPRFLHNLHHLVSDLHSVDAKLGSVRLKSSSLGRPGAALAASGARSWSSKDLLTLGQGDNGGGKSKIQLATERLHETYASLRAAEARAGTAAAEPAAEPYAADAFLGALRDVNATFEGNRQQDAHELLICVLNTIRETCRALAARAARLRPLDNGDSNGVKAATIDAEAKAGLRKTWKKRREIKERPAPAAEPAAETRPGWDFVADDFEGTMVMRTTCLECETVRELRQPVCDVCVPVADEADGADGAEPFAAQACAVEYLRDLNKYWCSVCLRYVEARRCAGYARLPRLLVLQLRRFSGGMQKITRHAPTPVEMACFCEACAARAPDQPPEHKYTLWAVIMHLGQSLSGGHYVAYARAGADAGAGAEPRCAREGTDAAAGARDGAGFMRALFHRPRQAQAGCAARDCCVPRPKESSWLACDDELVRPISNEEFEDLLSAEPKTRSGATPYLLFYVKSEVKSEVG